MANGLFGICICMYTINAKQTNDYLVVVYVQKKGFFYSANNESS